MPPWAKQQAAQNLKEVPKGSPENVLQSNHPSTYFSQRTASTSGGIPVSSQEGQALGRPLSHNNSLRSINYEIPYGLGQDPEEKDPHQPLESLADSKRWP